MDDNYDIFKILKSIRIENKLNLEDIAAKTRIRLSYLQAIENGEIDKIPSVYDKLFFQTYLEAIRVDNPDYYMDAFQQLRKGSRSGDPTTITTLRTVKPETHSLVKKRFLYVGIPILLTVVIIIILALYSKRVDSPATEEVMEVQVQDIVDELEARDKMRQDSLEAVQQKQRDGVIVDLRALEVTWLRLVTDKADTTEMLLQVSDSVTVKADSVMEFLIGKASGLNFRINGDETGVIGKKGEIITNLTITKDGIIRKRVKTAATRGMTNDSTFNN